MPDCASVPQVALVSMPFHVSAIPPISLGLLQSALLQAGIPTRTYNFNLHFLPYISKDLNAAASLYDEICYYWDFLPGEWLFAPHISESLDGDYLSALDRQSTTPKHIVQLLRRLRPIAGYFARQCAEILFAGAHDVVGFTSSFMQTQPSVAVASMLKIANPTVRMMFGGSNAFGEMGMAVLKQWRVFDVVANGECDRLIVPLVRALRGEPGFSLSELRGIFYRQDERLVDNSSDEFSVNMNELSMPDYSDYFATVTELGHRWGQKLDLPQFLPIETSRGCWWGEKSHCTFCGLNGERMAFRSKAPNVASSEFHSLYQRYRVPRFFAVDNIIDHKYFDTVLKTLAAHDPPLFVHYEIKANLKRRHVEALAAAGVRKVQPGIESLSTPILRLMRKGITAIQNVQTLKWLTEFGMQVSWFVLYGFPGENVESYREMAVLLPRIAHLTPPNNLAPVYLERFSPYHTTPEAFGIRNIGPAMWYQWAFPEVPDEVRSRLAYRFDFVEPKRDPEINRFVEERIAPIIKRWKALYSSNGCTLGLVHGPAETAIVCGPFSQPERIVRVNGSVSSILRMTESICAEAKILERLSAPLEEVRILHRSDPMTRGSPEVIVGGLDAEEYDDFLKDMRAIADQRREPEGSPTAVLEALDRGGLVMREGGHVLGLAVNWTERARGNFNYCRSHHQSHVRFDTMPIGG